MTRRHSPLAALVMIAMVAVISAGCGGPRSSGVTNAPAAPAVTAGGGTSIATAREKAVKFAECMRANGVGAFPAPDASGELTIDEIANGSSVDTSSAVFVRSLRTCKDLEPPGFTGTRVTPSKGRRVSRSLGACATTACRTSPTPPETGHSSTPIDPIHGNDGWQT